MPYIKLETVTPSSTNVVTFSSLPQAYDNLVIKWVARDNSSGVTNNDFIIAINSDTTAANYDRDYYTVNPTSFSTGQANSRYILNTSTGASQTSNCFAAGELLLSGYAKTSVHKLLGAWSVIQDSTTTGNMYFSRNNFVWKNNAAITSISFTLSTGSFISGSKFQLYAI